MKRIAALVCLVGVAAPSSAQNMFHGNVARTGVCEGAGPTRFHGIKWTFKAAGSVVTSPVIWPMQAITTAG